MAYKTSMRTLFKHWAVFSAPLLLILAAIYFSFASEADVAVFFKQHRAAHPALKTVMKFATDWSNPVFYVLYGVMLILAFRSKNNEKKRYLIILLVVQGIVAAACVHFLKHTIGRPRPDQNAKFFQPLTTRGSFHSLPSGHTTEIIGWSLPLALRNRTLWLTTTLSLFVGWWVSLESISAGITPATSSLAGCSVASVASPPRSSRTHPFSERSKHKGTP